MDGDGGGLSIKFLVGFSGGRDSHVLLHALRTYENVRAIHVNHGLLPDAKKWEERCIEWCESYDIPLVVCSLNLVPILGESLENVARKARYNAFLTHLQPHEILMTAHHLNDQAETVLLQLLRGAGVKGLAAMPLVKRMGKGWHARPFLTISQEEIAEYAKEHQLEWVEDPSNTDLRFRRNFLRHQVMDNLATLNPDYARCLARSAMHCAQTQSLLESYLEQDLVACEKGEALIVSVLKAWPQTRQQAIFRLWLSKKGYPLPSTLKLQVILEQMTQARIDRKPCVEWGDVQAVREKGLIRIVARTKMPVQ